MRYLEHKIQNNATGGFFNRICFIPSEVQRESNSEFTEDLQSLNEDEICEIFGWKFTEKTESIIKNHLAEDESNIMGLLIRQKKFGFIAECYHPVHYNFSVKKDGSRGGSWTSQAHCHIDWLYGDTIGELVHLLEEQAEKWIQYDFEKEQKEKEQKA